ncbi:MAG: OmpA family protein, partial [Saprospiraceae bacterium]
SSASANKLLTITGSFVLSFLKKKSTTENYGVSGLTTWLGGYKREIINAIPSELKSILNFTNLTSTVNQEFDSKPTSDENGSNWWMWLIGLIGLLALLWTMMKACNTSDRDDMVQTKIENVNNTLNDSTTLGSNTINSNTNDLMNSLDSSVKAKWDLLGQSIKLTLPGGIEMNAPEKGVENALISFINDKSKMVDKTTWFNFDRILFETGKATLNPVSMDQISNINSILKAYPSVEIKIGGYTDNTGDPKANQKLSLERAEAVRTSLVEKGVEGIRMVAEGYGQEHPIADNKTEAGRDLNRRVAIRVTKK